MAEKTMEEMEGIANFLWHLLDTIDTADDVFKKDDKAFRNYVYSAQQRRFEVSSSDGYKVWWTPEESPVPESVEPDRLPSEAPEKEE